MDTLPKQPRSQYKFIMLLAMIYLTADLASNVVVYRMADIFGFVETTAILIFPLTYVIGDALAEVYGYGIVRQVIWFDLFCNLLFSVLLVTSVHLPTPADWTDNPSYVLVLGSMLRVTAGTFFGSVISEFANAYMISKLKIMTSGKIFWLRSIIASTVGELALLVISMSFAFSGKTSIPKMLHLFLNAYLFELAFIVVAVVPLTLLVFFLKKSEKIDVYDYRTNFNPFRLDVE